MENLSQNASGSVFSGHLWLDTHHAIKSRLRTELVAKLPINTGDRVLDLGCGTGTWSLLAADKVGLRGRVLAIDPDAGSISLAQRRADDHYLKSVLSFEVGDLGSVLRRGSQFDAILLFNTLSFFPDAKRALTDIVTLLSPNGKLFVKDTDILSNFFWPDPQDILPQIYACAQAADSPRVGGSYDPFFARKIPRLLHEFEGVTFSTFSQAFSLFSRLLPEEREYVRGNAALMADVVEQNGHEELAAAWLSYFDEHDPRCILGRPDFMFTMTEFIFELKAT